MSISAHIGTVLPPRVTGPESMYALIMEAGIIPFFENPIPGFSVEEHTPPEHWFTDESLGPWDWKIHCVQSGEIAYGKFLWGGKAAFATVEVYRELMNWRRSQPRYQPTPEQQKILDLVNESGSVAIPDVRRLLGVKKSAADAQVARLMQQTRLVTGDIQRVYRGADLHYNGWQRSSFCAPEALFEEMDFPLPGYVPRSIRSSLTPRESLDFVKELVRARAGDVPERLLDRMLL